MLIFSIIYLVCFGIGVYQWVVDSGEIKITSLVFLILVGWILGPVIWLVRNGEKFCIRLKKYNVTIYKKD